MTGAPARSGGRRTPPLAEEASMSTCRTVHPSARPGISPPPGSLEHAFEYPGRVAVNRLPRPDGAREVRSRTTGQVCALVRCGRKRPGGRHAEDAPDRGSEEPWRSTTTT